MRQKLCLLFIGILMISGLSAQNAELIDWKFLAQVEFKDQYFDDYEAWYLVPHFSEEVKQLNGKPVIITGYVIPLDVAQGKYALSAYPFSSCFFCGGAGPETVMNLEFEKKPPRFDTDDFVTFKGILQLNATDFDRFSYILKEAEKVE